MAFTRSGVSATQKSILQDHLGPAINVKTDFGAVGNGTGNDGPAIQAALNAAYGSPSSPHGNAGKFTNRSVYIPSGSYPIGAPLYLVNVFGAHIYGDSMLSTRLFYTGSFSGNTEATSTGGANTITPLIMTNGMSFSLIERMNLSIGSSSPSTCLYLYQDGTKGQTNQNTFINIQIESAVEGVLIGYQSNALCSENVFINCNAQACTHGARIISFNALNNHFLNFGAASCTAGISHVTGGVYLWGGNFSGNTTDVVTGTDPVSMIGIRTESANFVDASAAGGPHTITSCFQTCPGNGFFLNAGGGGTYAIIDGCRQTQPSLGSTPTPSSQGQIQGSATSKIYLRASRFDNTTYLSTFTGVVGQNI
jgi:hypothetical protein